jgi:gas vesicle protein GvpA/GvpJ/GvpM family
MSETSPAPATRGYSPARDAGGSPAPANLADILERVLDKGIIIAGDIQVNLLDIELLTIRIRLLIVSVDKAQEMGIDWWRHDKGLTSTSRELEDENRELRERVEALESRSGSQQSRARKRT